MCPSWVGEASAASNDEATGQLATGYLPWPGLVDACLLTAAFLVAEYVGDGLAAAMAAAYRRPLPLWCDSLLRQLAGVALTGAVAATVRRRGRGRVLAIRGLSIQEVLLIVLLAMTLNFAGRQAENWGWRFLPRLEGAKSMPTTASAGFVGACLVIPLVQETFFRGFLGRGLVARFGPLGGLLLTSLLYGVAHVDTRRFAHALAAGCVLHGVYLCCQSIAAPVLLHALANFIALPCRSMRADGLDLAALLACGGLMWLMYRSRVRWVGVDGRQWSPGYASTEMPPLTAHARAQSELPPWWLKIVAFWAYLPFLYLLFGELQKRLQF
jgi:membrane protease YdiL (CAAX protease family)